MKEEIGKALKTLVMLDGQPDPAVLKALSDPLAVRSYRRCRGPDRRRRDFTCRGSQAADGLRPRRALCAWPWRLIHARDKAAVPALIDLVAELPRANRGKRRMSCPSGRHQSPGAPVWRR